MAEVGVARTVASSAAVAAVALFRTALGLHAALVVTQPIAAGAMLQASVAGRAIHQGVGGVLLLVAMIQIPLAVLAWRPGRWPAWPAVISTALLVAEITQLTLGYGGELAVHLPLGVAITATVLATWIWSLRDRRVGEGRWRGVRGRREQRDLDPRGGRGAADPRAR